MAALPRSTYDPNKKRSSTGGYSPNSPSSPTYQTGQSNITLPKRTTNTSDRPVPGYTEYKENNYEVDPNAWVTGDTPDWWGGSEANNLYDSTLNSYADDQSRQSLNSLRAAFSQNRSDLVAQKPTIQQEASELRNKADTNYYTNDLQSLYKAMEAGGQKGGENITGMVSANATRGQGHNNANLYETNQLRNIDNAVSSLGSRESQALAEAQMGINSEVLANRLSGIRDAMSQAQQQRETEKSDYMNLIGSYGDDYMAEINNLKAQGVPDTDYRIRALYAARNQKIAGQNTAAEDQTQQDFENYLKQTQLNYDINKPYYKSGSSGSDLSYSEALTKYNAGDRSNAVLSALGLL